MKEVFPILSEVLFCCFFVWFILVYRLFSILENKHPEKYESMGRPKLFLNNDPASFIAFMKFLFKTEWRELNDRHLELLGESILLISILYMAGLITFFLGISQGYAP